MELSKFLSKVIGIYLVIVSAAMLANMGQFLVLANSLMNNEPLMFVTGFFTLIIGILMVVSHSVWEWSWRVMVTIISWLTMLKGMFILFSPGFMYIATQYFPFTVANACITGCIDMFIGLLFIYYGFRREV